MSPRSAGRWIRLALFTRARGISLAALVLLASAGVAVTAGLSAADGDSGSRAPSVLDDPAVQTAADRSIQEQQARDAERDTAAARSDRSASREAYRDLSASEALTADKAQLPDVVTNPAFKPFEPDAGAHVERYRDGDTTAIVDTADGERVLAESNIPLRGTTAEGDRAPVDLSLEADAGRFAAASAPVRATLPSELGEGVALPVGDGTIRVRPVGANTPAARADDDKLLYANAQQDADVLAAPLPIGVELSNIIRSADAPETFAYDFDGLPDGAELRLTANGHAAEIVDGGDTLVLVRPPLASDADGMPLPVDLAVAGSRLELTIRHHDRDLRYPLVLDPTILPPETFTWNQPTQDPANNNDFTRWAYNFVPAAGSPAHATDLASTHWGIIGTGLYTYTAYGLQMWQYDDGVDSFTAPGDSYIYRADFQKLANSNSTRAGALPMCLNAGIFSRSRNAADSTFYVNCGTFNGVNWGTCVSGTYPSCSTTAGTGGNDAQLDYWAPSAGIRESGDGLKYAGGAVLYLNDRNKPGFGWANNVQPPQTWTDGTASYTLNVSDAGLGLYQTWILTDGWNGPVISTGCTGTRFDWAASPPKCDNANHGLTFSLGAIPEGVHTLQAPASDAVGNSDMFTYPLNLDRTPPKIPADGLSGPLWDDRNVLDDDGGTERGLITAPETVTVAATDGSSVFAPSADQRSGIASIEMRVDGVLRNAGDRHDASCSTARCPYDGPTDKTFTFDPTGLATGDHKVTIIVRDKLAPPGDTSGPHVASTSFDVYVENGALTTTATGETDASETSAADTPDNHDEDLVPQLSQAQVDLATTTIKNEAASPMTALHAVLGSDPFAGVTPTATVADVGQVTQGTDPTTGKAKIVGAIADVNLNAPLNVDAVVPAVAPPLPGDTDNYHYSAHMVGADMTDLTVVVHFDSATTAHIDRILPGQNSDAQTFDPIPASPVPSVPETSE